MGGLSGIDYNPSTDTYYLISDDKSEKNPARFYTAKISLTEKGIKDLQFKNVHYLLQQNGELFPGSHQDRFKVPDPESIRLNSRSGELVWSNEGERIVRNGDTVLSNPSITVINEAGKFISEYQMPDNIFMKASSFGPRKNGVLEGLSFADNYETLYASVEEPLYQDGPVADVTDKPAFIRLLKFSTESKKCVTQYAYKLEPVAYPATPENEFKVNGVSEILALSDNRLLVMERSFSTGRLPCTIKLFIADLTDATDISNQNLKDNREFVPVKKQLLLNMDDLGIYTDNIEGITFGPTLPNGRKTLLFVADNNFKFFERAQLLLFEVVE